MARRLRLAVVALAFLCCCLVHAPTTGGAAADASFPPGMHGLEVVQQDTRVTPPSSSCAAADQAVVAGEAELEAAAGSTRMDLELEDYPGSGANDRHSPWAQQRRH